MGSKLHDWLQERGGRLYYWRDRNDEVDCVAEWGKRLLGERGIIGKLKAKAFQERHLKQ